MTDKILSGVVKAEGRDVQTFQPLISKVMFFLYMCPNLLYMFVACDFKVLMNTLKIVCCCFFFLTFALMGFKERERERVGVG